ncbi:hypothetical protein E2P81_ATG05600 [Venturia nashicola]|nr:hypothetical protein E2P81_ATG05600 [Venturia nashicola]
MMAARPKPSPAIPTISPSTKRPTTFLSLPREIRQAILIQSFESDLPPLKNTFQKIIRAFRRACNKGTNESKACKDNLSTCYAENHRRLHWVDTLSRIHVIVRQDMVYVKAEWKRTFDKRVGELAYRQLATAGN